MTDPLETEVFTALREALCGDTRLSRRVALLEPQKSSPECLPAWERAQLKPNPVAKECHTEIYLPIVAGRAAWRK